MIDKNFYKNNGIYLAKNLLGKIFVHNIDGYILKGRIVETEAYMGVIDKASHAHNGRRTKRTEIMYNEGGILYVYFIYGLYHCVNVVANEKDVPEAVLIRAIEPINNWDKISQNRFNKEFNELSKKEIVNLTNGPSKLTMAYEINGSLNGEPLGGTRVYIEDDLEGENFEIVEAKRVGINYAEEAKDFLYRFYIKDNKYVSKKIK